MIAENARLVWSFLLTRLMRGVTSITSSKLSAFVFLLTRLMRGVTAFVWEQIQRLKISTHTPHARRDQIPPALDRQRIISTHTPHARRDMWDATNTFDNTISTHTPHARRDFHVKR